jgi:DNA-binding GntR family transcriptional regulator
MDAPAACHSALGSKEAADPAAGQIARSIERDIFRGRLQPGEKLGEEELAERFGASRHHVREALVRLTRVGIIVKERNRGASVRRFTADEVRQIYEVREILQRQAALRIRLPAEPAAIERLARMNEDYERAVAAGELHEIHETNDRFHAEVFRLCDNDLLVSLIELYMEMTYAVRGAAFANRESLEKSQGHHRIMVQLLSGTDSWALAQLCVDHIQITKDRYLAGLRGELAKT